jgi:electron transfer flavoprotein beta subunit
MSLNAAVLLRPILDPELPADQLLIDAATNRPVPGAPLVLGPFERSALEVAMKLRDAGAVARVTVIAASTAATDALRKSLAVKADEAVLVDADLDSLDALPTVEVLARTLERRGPFDLVLAGRQAGDWDGGQTGYLLAERLGWPSVGLVRKAWVESAQLHALQDSPQGLEEVVVATPAVLVVTTDDSNVLRLARVPDLMAASRKPIAKVSLADLGIANLDRLSGLEVRSVRVLDNRVQCEFVPGETPSEVIHALAARLLELAPS